MKRRECVKARDLMIPGNTCPPPGDEPREFVCKAYCGEKVSGLVTKEAISARDDNPLIKCVDRVLEHVISIIPATDHGSCLFEALCESDLSFAVAGGLLRSGR